MKVQVKRIGIWSIVRNAFLIIGITTFVIAMLSLGFALVANKITPAQLLQGSHPISAALMLLGAPLFYGLVGAIVACIASLLFNLLAKLKFIGGIVLEVETSEKLAQNPEPMPEVSAS